MWVVCKFSVPLNIDDMNSKSRFLFCLLFIAAYTSFLRVVKAKKFFKFVANQQKKYRRHQSCQQGYEAPLRVRLVYNPHGLFIAPFIRSHTYTYIHADSCVDLVVPKASLFCFPPFLASIVGRLIWAAARVQEKSLSPRRQWINIRPAAASPSFHLRPPWCPRSTASLMLRIKALEGGDGRHERQGDKKSARKKRGDRSLFQVGRFASATHYLCPKLSDGQSRRFRRPLITATDLTVNSRRG